MERKKEYRLAFLFESQDGDSQSLEKEIRRVLSKQLQGKSLQLGAAQVSTGRLRIEFSGGRKVVDACHGKLDKEVCSSVKFARLTDEVSDELRTEAYPLVSKLEQELRRFIQEAMTDVLGFSWWDKLDAESVKTRVSSVRAKNQGGFYNYNPIEFSEFEHLVAIITGNLAFWREDRPLTVSDLQDLLSQSSDIAELQKKLAGKTEKKSFWDTVFSRLFENEEEWQKAEKSLTNVVIPLRHKVMHHRPMREYEFQQLKQASQAVREALEAKKRKLNPQAKAKLKDEAEALSQSLRQAQENYQRHLQSINDVFANSRFLELVEFQKLQSEKVLPLFERQYQLREQLDKFFLPIKENQERFRKQLDEMTRPAQEFREQIEKVTRSFKDSLVHIKNPLASLEKKK